MQVQRADSLTQKSNKLSINETEEPPGLLMIFDDFASRCYRELSFEQQLAMDYKSELGMECPEY